MTDWQPTNLYFKEQTLTERSSLNKLDFPLSIFSWVICRKDYYARSRWRRRYYDHLPGNPAAVVGLFIGTFVGYPMISDFYNISRSSRTSSRHRSHRDPGPVPPDLPPRDID